MLQIISSGGRKEPQREPLALRPGLQKRWQECVPVAVPWQPGDQRQAWGF